MKIENNTQTGAGVYSEPVQDKRQALDDAEIWYAKVGGLYDYGFRHDPDHRFIRPCRHAQNPSCRSRSSIIRSIIWAVLR